LPQQGGKVELRIVADETGEYELPEGYQAVHIAAGYSALFGPLGVVVRPHKGKWRGAKAIFEAAIAEVAGVAQTSTPAKPEEELEAKIAGPSSEGGFLSVAAIAELVAEEPAAVDRLLAAELQRPEGKPRKTALLAFLEAEQNRATGPRAPVIGVIEKALQAFGQAKKQPTEDGGPFGEPGPPDAPGVPQTADAA